MRKIRKAFFCFLAVVLFTGCSQLENLKIPSKIGIKGSPDWNFSLGDLEYDLEKIDTGSDFSFSKEGIKNTVSSSSGFDCYEYNPDNKYPDELQFLLTKNIQDIDLDFSEMIKNIGLSDFAEKASISKEVTVPSIQYNQKIQIDLSSVQKQLNELVFIAGTTAGGSIEIKPDESAALTGSNNGFNSITYKSGELVITTSKSYTKNQSVTFSHNGKIIATGKFNGNTCSVDLTGKTLYTSGMEVSFSPDKDVSVWFTGTVSEDSIVASADGLTISDMSVSVEETLDTKNSFSSFDSCTVGDGEINFALKLDESWTGCEITYPITLTGGITGKSKNNGSSEVISLKNKTLKPENTKLSSEVTISFDNGTFVYDKAPEFEADISINKISEIIITLDDITLEQKLSGEIGDIIKEIDVGKSSIKCNYINTLPEGNEPIKITFVSKFLGFDDVENMECNHPDGSFEFVASQDSKISKITANPTAEDEFSAIDFYVKVDLPGSTENNPGRIKLCDIVPGATYEFGFGIDPSFGIDNIKWNKVVINTAGFSQSGNLDTGVNPSSLLSILDDYLKTEDNSQSQKYLESLPFYLFITKPDMPAFDDAKLQGTVQITSSKSGASVDYLVGSAEGPEDIVFSDIPDFSQTDENDVVISDIASQNLSLNKDLAEYVNKFNDADSSIVINYNFNFVSGKNSQTEITITPDDIQGTQKLSIIVALVLPLKFGFEKPVYLDVMDIAGLNQDIFGRTEASTDETIAEFSKYLEYAKVNAYINEFPLNCDNLNLCVNVFGNDEKYKDEEQIVKLAAGENVSLKVDKADELMNVYPLIPEVKFEIPAVDGDSNWLSISRNFSVSAKVSLEIKAEYEYSFNLGGN